jgi:hypothetical protein
MFHGDERTLIQQLLLESFHANIYVDFRKAVRPAMVIVICHPELKIRRQQSCSIAFLLVKVK